MTGEVFSGPDLSRESDNPHPHTRALAQMGLAYPEDFSLSETIRCHFCSSSIDEAGLDEINEGLCWPEDSEAAFPHSIGCPLWEARRIMEMSDG